jgi:hypothetical protein
MKKHDRLINTPHGVSTSTRTSDTPNCDQSYDVAVGASTATFANNTPNSGRSYDAPYTASATAFTRSVASSTLSSYHDPHPPMSTQEFSAASAPKPREQYAENKPRALFSGSAATNATANKLKNPHQSTTYTSPPQFTAHHSNFSDKEPEPPCSSRTEHYSASPPHAAQSPQRGFVIDASKYSCGPPDQNKVRSWSENSRPIRPESPPSDRYADYLRQNTIYRRSTPDVDDEANPYGGDEGYPNNNGFSWNDKEESLERRDRLTVNDVSSSSDLLSATQLTGPVLKR